MQIPVHFNLEIPIPKANESRGNVKIRVMSHTRAMCVCVCLWVSESVFPFSFFCARHEQTLIIFYLLVDRNAHLNDYLFTSYEDTTNTFDSRIVNFKRAPPRKHGTPQL